MSTRKKKDKEKEIASWNWEGQEQEGNSFKEMAEEHGFTPRLWMSLLYGTKWTLLTQIGQLNRTNWHSPALQSTSNSPQSLWMKLERKSLSRSWMINTVWRSQCVCGLRVPKVPFSKAFHSIIPWILLPPQHPFLFHLIAVSEYFVAGASLLLLHVIRIFLFFCSLFLRHYFTFL